MNLSFGNSLLNNKKFSNTSRANSSSASQASTGVKGSGRDGLLTMSDLKPGQSFKAQIVDTNYDNVRLRLEDGQVISARIDSAGEFNTGEEITFTVKDNDGIQLSISPAKIETPVNPTLLNALTSAGLPTDSEHLTMVQKMMQEQLPIDKQSLQSMHRNILNNPSTPIDNLVLMTKFNIPITQENLYQFDSYKNYEHQITKELSTLTDNLMATLSALANEADNPLQALEFNKALVELALEEAGFVAENTIAQEAGVEAESGAMQGTGVEAEGAVAQGAVIETESATMQGTVIGSEGAAAQGNVIETESAVTQGAAIETEGAVAQGNVIESENIVSQETNDIKTILTQDQLQTLSDTLKSAGMPQELVESVLKGEISDKELLKEINSEFNKMIQTQNQEAKNNTQNQSALKDMEAAKSIISDKGYQRLLSGAISKQWFINPSQVGEEQKVSNLYEKLDKQVKGLMDQLNKLGQEASGKDAVEKALANSSQSASHAAGNVDFMNQINQLYSFVQIPLKMNGQNAHSDLYVFTNKKNLSDPDGEIKALLHLDMDALGSVDAFLKLKGQALDTKFTLDNDETYELFEKHIDRLVTRLESKGYTCKIQFEKGHEEVDFVEDFLKQGQSVGNLQRFSFDVKA